MNFPADQIAELKVVASNLSIAEEGGYTFIYIQNLKLPEGCIPQTSDVLLCPTPRDGYNSRLFFPQKIEGPASSRNWNGNIRALDRNWTSISWQTTPDQKRLLETLQIQLNALRAK